MILPSAFLSGILIPVEQLAAWAQWISFLPPLFYANESLLTLIEPDGVLAGNWTAVAGLAAFGGAILALSSLTLREIEWTAVQ